MHTNNDESLHILLCDNKQYILFYTDILEQWILYETKRSRIIHTYLDAFMEEKLVALGSKDGAFWNILNLGSYECTISSVIKWTNFVKVFLLSFLKGNIFYWRSYLMSTYYVLSSLQKILRASCLSIFRAAYMVSSVLLFIEPNLQSHADVSCVTPPTETSWKTSVTMNDPWSDFLTNQSTHGLRQVSC